MRDLLTPLTAVDSAAVLLIVARLVLAWGLGLAIAGIYRRARPMNLEAESFTVTLVLLTILIAMVTQVIGDNVARAFSLVGALSIVRFRTVVRDTQDTAYVIFAVAIGMDADAVVGPTLDQFVSARRLASVTTARQGLSLDVTYQTALRAEHMASALVNALNRIEGVQAVELQRTEAQEG
jgi:hypothetical protein